MEERRQDPRGEITFEIRFRSVQEFLSAYSANISGGGMFVRTQDPLLLNQTVRLRFALPGVNHQFDCRGIVVWANPSSKKSFLPAGMGVKFVDMDAEAKRLIDEFVKKGGEHGGEHRS